MTEQIKQDLREETVQTPQTVAGKPRKKRSRSDRIGRERYNQQLLKRALDVLEDVKTELRWVRNKLDRIGEADYGSSDIERYAVEDDVDRAIIQRIREAGSPGILPKVAAADINRLGGLGLRYYEVSRRILRMNKKLHFETGKLLFEKRGHRWALTSFAVESWGKSADEVEGEVNAE